MNQHTSISTPNDDALTAQTTQSAELRRTRVYIADLMGPYDAYVDPDTCDCCVLPYFTIDTVEQIAADTRRMVAQNPDDSIVEIADDEVREIWMPNSPHERNVIILQPNPDGLYCVGADWLWELAVDRPDDAPQASA